MNTYQSLSNEERGRPVNNTDLAWCWVQVCCKLNSLNTHRACLRKGSFTSVVSGNQLSIYGSTRSD